jgi:hypothetical protein
MNKVNVNDDKKDIKKYIRDTITYIINKKMNSFNGELKHISNKIDKNIELTAELIGYLKLNNKISSCNSGNCNSGNCNSGNCNSGNSSKLLKNISSKSIKLLKDIAISNEKHKNEMNKLESNYDFNNEYIELSKNNLGDSVGSVELYISNELKTDLLIDKPINILTDIYNDELESNELLNSNSNETFNETYIDSFNDSIKYLSSNNSNKKSVKQVNKTKKTSSSLYKEVRVEEFNIDTDFIKECLSQCCLDGDIKLFKKMYIDDVEKTHYPIRHIKKKYQYWFDNKMNDDDPNGTYIKNTVIQNIENAYLSVNIYHEDETEMDDFIKNQEHISKLSEQKYREQFMKKIIGIITI